MNDRLATARALALAAAAVTALALAAIPVCITAGPGTDVDVRPALIHALRLTGPAIVPAGRPVRHPEMNQPGIDLHFDPALVRVPPDNADLLLPGP